jgi:hypothetical protein
MVGGVRRALSSGGLGCGQWMMCTSGCYVWMRKRDRGSLRPMADATDPWGREEIESRESESKGTCDQIDIPRTPLFPTAARLVEARELVSLLLDRPFDVWCRCRRLS